MAVRKRLCDPSDNLIALTGDEPIYKEVRWYDGNDTESLAGLIVERFLSRKS